MDIDEQAPAHEPVRTLGLAAVIVFAVLFVLFFFRALPLQLDPVRASNAPDQFNATRAIERLSRILDGKPHPVDSDALDATRERLLTEIRSLGYEPEVHDETACRGPSSGSVIHCARVRNITFSAGPANSPAIVLTAHYDSVEAGPGAGDDGIGVAVWLEVAGILKQAPPAKPVLFLITDGEETNLLGAQAFANQKMYGREVSRVINLEARGNRGPAMMFETSHPNSGVVSDWAAGAPRPVSNSMMTAVYELLPNSTDLTVYLRAKQAGVNMAVADGFDFYHTEHDDIAHIDPRSVQPGAVLVEPKPGGRGLSLRIEFIDIVSQAGQFDPCMWAGATVEDRADTLSGWSYDGPQAAQAAGAISLLQDFELLKRVIRAWIGVYLKKVDEGRIAPAEVDHLLCHYSAKSLREEIVALLDKTAGMIPEEKWFSNLATVGNVGSASIWVMLDAFLKSGRLRCGEKVLCIVPESGRAMVGFMLLEAVE